MWILNNFSKDLLFIIAPGLWCLALLKIIPNDSILYTSLLVLLLTIDSSHIYSTFWRTIFDSTEFKRSKFLYLIAPLIIGLLLFSWFFFNIPFFWNFIIYLTVYHQIKQAVGLQKWYSKINHYFEQTSSNIMYACTIFSFMAFHFKTNPIVINFYSANDIFSYPNEFLFLVSISLLCLTMLYWLIFEVNNYLNKRFFINKFLLMLIFMSVQIWCFLLGSSMIEVILPQLVYHAVSYQASIIRTSKNLKRNNNKLLFKTITIVFFSLIIGFGANQLENVINSNPNGNLIPSLILALYMIPTLSHHLWDAFIWKKSHPDWYHIFELKENTNELDK